MVFLPDLGAAVLYAVVEFLLVLGFLVVFVETIRLSRVVVFLVADAAMALVLWWLNELGVAFIVLGLGFALVANHAFDRLTTR